MNSMVDSQPSHSAMTEASLASPPPIQPKAKQPKATASTTPPAAQCMPKVDSSMPVNGDSTTKAATSDQRQPVGDGHGHQVGDGRIGHRQRKHSKKDLVANNLDRGHYRLRFDVHSEI